MNGSAHRPIAETGSTARRICSHRYSFVMMALLVFILGFAGACGGSDQPKWQLLHTRYDQALEKWDIDVQVTNLRDSEQAIDCRVTLDDTNGNFLGSDDSYADVEAGQTGDVLLTIHNHAVNGEQPGDFHVDCQYGVR
jgi:hypothetical protein